MLPEFHVLKTIQKFFNIRKAIRKNNDHRPSVNLFSQVMKYFDYLCLTSKRQF